MATLNVHGCIYTYIRTSLDTISAPPSRSEFACMLGQDLSKELDLSGIYRLSYERKEIAALMHENLLDGGKLEDHFEISAETHCSTLPSTVVVKIDRCSSLTFSYRNFPVK